jgi:hypothetical protein
MGLLDKWESEVPSVDMDIFKVGYVTAIRIHYYPDPFRSQSACSASVEFKRSGTEGKQNLKADSVPEMLEKIEAFLRALEEEEN